MILNRTLEHDNIINKLLYRREEDAVELRSFFEDIVGIRDKSVIEQALVKAEVRTIRRGKLLFTAGEQCPEFYLLSNGLLRGYLLHEEGQEITDRFFWKCGDFIIGSSGVGIPAEINVVAMTTCQIVVLPMSLVAQLVEENMEAMRLYNRQLHKGLRCHWNEKLAFHYGSAMERYHWMTKLYPEWDGMIPDKYLASYLRMTPVTLSRLRRKLRESGEGK